jgi:Protein of unknown function (DUF2796)
MVRACAAILTGLLATAPAVAADKTAPDRHRAHQHGAAKLQVSLDGRALQISFEGPADNILGFEHAPKNDAQKKALVRAEEQLKQPTQLFAIPPAAECQAQPVRLDTRLPAAGDGETHSEMEVDWRWECAEPQALTHVDVGLFKAFPRLKQLHVHVATAQGQKAAVLKPGAARLKIGS